MRRGQVRFGLPFTWIVVGLLLLGETVSAAPHAGVPAVFPFIQKDLDLTLGQLGLIPGAMAIGGAATVLLAGWLADAWGSRRIIIAGIIGTGMLLFLFSQMQSLAYGIMFGLLLSSVNCWIYPSAVKGIMDWLPPRTQALGIGIKQVGVPIAGTLSAAILPSIAVAFGWRVAVMALSGWVVAIAIIFFLIYRDNPETKNRLPVRHSLMESIPLMIRNRDILLCSLCGGILSGLHVASLSFLMLFLKEELLFSTVKAGGFLAITQLSTIPGRVGWGVAGDFLFRGQRVIVLVLIGLSSALVLGAFTLLSPETPDILVAILAVGIGFTVLSWVGPYTILVVEIAGPGFTGIAIGLSNVIVRIITAALPPLFGLLVDVTEAYTLSWGVIAGLAVVAAGTMRFLRPESRRL